MKNIFLLVPVLFLILILFGCSQGKESPEKLPTQRQDTTSVEMTSSNVLQEQISVPISSSSKDMFCDISSTLSETTAIIDPLDMEIDERLFVGIPIDLVDPNAMTKLSHDDAISSVAKVLLDKKVDLLDHRFISLWKSEIDGYKYIIVKEFIGEDDYSVKTLNWYYVNDEYGYIYIYDETTLEFERIY